MRLRFLAPAVFSLASVTTLACSSQPADDDADDSALASATATCQADGAYPNAAFGRVFPDLGPARKVGNFAVWPSNDGSIPADVIKARSAPDDALQNLSARFGACSGDMAAHIKSSKPNVYVYFTGFGGAQQNNAQVDEPAVMKWINDRDPNGIIFSVSWNCQSGFCKTNAQALAPKNTSPEWQTFERSVRVIQGAAQAQQAMGVMSQLAMQQTTGYDSALSHAMELGALLVDQILVADQGPDGKERFGKIHFLGYSMGAHVASDILVQDFTPDASVGFKWTRGGMCEGGKDTCTVAELKKVHWSLGMGTPGWSESLKSYTKGRATPYELFKNGGLLRIDDPRFKNKLNILNRRMDPTSTSDDTFERGLGDIFFGDYNHYSHDYSLPLFVSPGFVQALDAFVEAEHPKNVEELGILADTAGLVDFDECKEGQACAARNTYLAHNTNRSHQKITLPQVASVPTTDGVPRPDRAQNRAVSFTASGAKPVVLQSMDQEDLRGAVELYYRPTAYNPTAPGQDFGLFSYGQCSAAPSNDDLMPSAYVSADGNLVFSMAYQGQTYEARTPAASAKLAKGAWTHLAFTWELPVESLTKNAKTDEELQAALPSMQADLQKYSAALIWANGLQKPLATTYNRQKGQGTLRIYANGRLAVEAPLGKADSARECLTMAQALPGQAYDTGNDGTYSPYLPYANVTPAASSDIVALNPQTQLGTRCKAYKVRNVPVVFGCAHGTAAVNAGGDMDELTLVYGKGREQYDNVGADGKPKNWSIGVSYGATPFKAK